MKWVRELVINAVVGGLLVLMPVYLALLVLMKAVASVVGLIHPIASLLPDWLPAVDALALGLVLVLCFLVGMAVRTRVGHALRERVETSLFGRLPGYALFRSLTQRLAGAQEESAWKPALAEIEEALVPAFIIEELDDGRFTVFVPSVPTPLAGAVYVLAADRVHPVDVPFTEAVKSVSRWGEGVKAMAAAVRVGDLR